MAEEQSSFEQSKEGKDVYINTGRNRSFDSDGNSPRVVSGGRSLLGTDSRGDVTTAYGKRRSS